MSNIEFQRDYLASLVDPVGNESSGEIEFTLDKTPLGDFGFLLIDKNGADEEVVFYHKKTGNSVFVYGSNRSNPVEHLSGTKVYLVSTIESLNYLSNISFSQFYIFKKTESDVIIKGGKVFAGTEIIVDDVDTSEGNPDQILIAGNINYVFIDEGLIKISTTYNNQKFNLGEITVDGAGNITNIDMSKTFVIEGLQGTSITDLSFKSTDGLEDTYTITFSNGTSKDFIVTNGERGITGKGIDSVVSQKVGKETTLTITGDFDNSPFIFKLEDGKDGLGLLPEERDFLNNDRGSYVISSNIELGNPQTGGEITTFNLQVEGFIKDNGEVFAVNVNQSEINITNIANESVTYILVDKAGNIIQQDSPPTTAQTLNHLCHWVVVHSDNITANTVNDLSLKGNNTINQFHNYARNFGYINLNGNEYSANGANLKINKSAGEIMYPGLGENNQKSQTAITALPFRIRNQNGTETPTDITDLDVLNYDNGGVTTPIPGATNSVWAVYRIFLFADQNITRLARPQFYYDNKDEALLKFRNEHFILEKNFKDNGTFLGYILFRKNTTDLTSSENQFLPAEGLGSFGGTSFTPTLNAVYNVSGQPQITTTIGAVQLKGGETDSDNVLEILDTSGNTTATIQANGIPSKSTDLITKNHLEENYTTSQPFIAGEDLSDGDFVRKGLESLGEDINKYYIKKPGEYIQNIYFVKNNYLTGDTIEIHSTGDCTTSGLLNLKEEYSIQEQSYRTSNTFTNNASYGFIIKSQTSFTIKNNLNIKTSANGSVGLMAHILDVNGNILKSSQTVSVTNSGGLVFIDFVTDTTLTPGTYAICLENLTGENLFIYLTEEENPYYKTFYSNGNVSTITDLNALSEYSYRIIHTLSIEYSAGVGSSIFLKPDNTFGFHYPSNNDIYIGTILNDTTIDSNISNFIDNKITLHKSSSSGIITIEHGLGRKPIFIKVEGFILYDSDQAWTSSGYWKNGGIMSVATNTNKNEQSGGATVLSGKVVDFSMDSYFNSGPTAIIENVTDISIDFNLTASTNNQRATSYLITLY